jgi:long-chain fatty acid transport protein
LVPRLGAERAFQPTPSVAMHVRGGFFLEPSPAPAQSKVANLYDNHRVAVTLGYGVEVGPVGSTMGRRPAEPGSLPYPGARIALDLFGQAQALIPRDHVKEGDVPAEDPGTPSVTTRGVIGAFGTTVGVKF